MGRTRSSLTATAAERVWDNWLLKLDVLDQRSAAQNANSAAFSPWPPFQLLKLHKIVGAGCGVWCTRSKIGEFGDVLIHLGREGKGWVVMHFLGFSEVSEAGNDPVDLLPDG